MPRVILQPASSADAQKHFRDTILTPVPLSRIQSFLPQGQAVPDALVGLTAVPVWGVTPGAKGQNARTWQDVQVGDVALFYAKRSFFASSVVIAKVHAPALARALWGMDPGGATWEYIYFLDEITDRDLPVGRFNQVMGYQANNIVQGFHVVADHRAEDLYALFDLESETVEPETTEEEYLQAVTLPAVPLDRDAQVRRRVEQRFLRKFLFYGRTQRTCCLCGHLLPVELLVAAHIKRRADCTDAEKRDYRHIVAPMCHLGCDALYERNYVIVDDQGTVRVNVALNPGTALAQHLATIQGRTCSVWTPDSAPYFAWHAAQRRRRAT